MTVPNEAGTWRKSSLSTNTDTCVEVRRGADNASVRDTKNREAGHFTVGRQAWLAFLQAAVR